MKITRIAAHLLAVPFDQTHIPTDWFGPGFPQLIVEIETDQGLTGWGEAFCLGAPKSVKAALDDLLAPMLLGRDPADIAGLQQEMFRRSHIWGRYGVIVSAISGLDIALWDLAGREAGLPLHRLLGGPTEVSIPVYASLLHYDDPDQLRDVVNLALETGASAIKIHQTDLNSVRLTREAIGPDRGLMVDVNCPWNPIQARAAALAMKEYDLTWLEEPIWPPEDFKSLAELRRLTGQPLALGENACTVHQFKALLDAGAADYIMPSVAKVGGVTEWRKVAVLAEAYNVSLAPHSFYFGPGLLATAHLVAAAPGCGLLEHLFGQPEASLFTEPVRPEAGRLDLPSGPGLGPEPDRAVLREYRVKE